MYQAKNGFTLLDATTPDGWTIQTAEDILTALLAFPYFQSVADCFLWDAIGRAAEERKVYDDIKDLAAYIAKNYI